MYDVCFDAVLVCFTPKSGPVGCQSISSAPDPTRTSFFGIHGRYALQIVEALRHQVLKNDDQCPGLASGQRIRSAYKIDGEVLLDLTDDDLKELDCPSDHARSF